LFGGFGFWGSEESSVGVGAAVCARSACSTRAREEGARARCGRSAHAPSVLWSSTPLTWRDRLERGRVRGVHAEPVDEAKDDTELQQRDAREEDVEGGEGEQEEDVHLGSVCVRLREIKGGSCGVLLAPTATGAATLADDEEEDPPPPH